jgi:hypothetical protein
VFRWADAEPSFGARDSAQVVFHEHAARTSGVSADVRDCCTERERLFKILLFVSERGKNTVSKPMHAGIAIPDDCTTLVVESRHGCRAHIGNGVSQKLMETSEIVLCVAY